MSEAEDWIRIPWSAIAMVSDVYHLSKEEFERLSFKEFMGLYMRLSPYFFDYSQPVDHEKMSKIVETMHPRARLEVTRNEGEL